AVLGPEVGPATCPDTARSDDAGRSDELGPDADGPQDVDLSGPDEPGQRTLRVPGAIEPPGGGVEPGEILRVAEQDGGPEQAVGRSLVEAHPIRRRAGVRLLPG